MTYYSNRFPVRVLKLRGFEAQDMHIDKWGCPQIGKLAVKASPGVRLGWNMQWSPDRQPRTVLERWMGQLGGRGTSVELDPESIEASTAYFVGACPEMPRNRSRVVVNIEGVGLLPELDDRAVHVKVMAAMLHAPKPQELVDAPFVNEAYLAQLPRS